MIYTLAKHRLKLCERVLYTTLQWGCEPAAKLAPPPTKHICVQTNRIGGKVSVDCSMSPWTSFIWNTAGLLLGQEQKKKGNTRDKTNVHQQNPIKKNNNSSFIWPIGECPETGWLPSDCALDNARHKSYCLDKAWDKYPYLHSPWAFTFQFKDGKWAFMSQGYGGERLSVTGRSSSLAKEIIISASNFVYPLVSDQHTADPSAQYKETPLIRVMMYDCRS